MSTPENKLETAAANVSSALSKAKTVWQHWETYIIAVVCFIVGALVGHKIH